VKLLTIEQRNEVDKIELPDSDKPKCRLCKLKDKCLSPKMQPTGKGRKQILVVAEAPGKDEDEKGIQLIGKAGQRLRKTLRELDCSLDRDCWKTNAVICRPPENKIQDKYVKFCRPNLYRTINKLNPVVIILLGSKAVDSFIGREWGKGVGGIGRWAGWRIPLQARNTWVCPTYHPSYLLRKENQQTSKVLSLWFERHLKAAMELEDRPWEEIPDYSRKVQVIMSPEEAAGFIRRQAGRGPVSFDYETNMLKPDSSRARIVSCAMCWEGSCTIAYPWEGEAIKATQEVLRSPVPKYGANAKFEQRWTLKEFGHGVRNWRFDTMQAAHILDNRPWITSVKFQAFVQLGLPPWDHHIEPYLNVKQGNKENRIAELDMKDLLEYNGMDALVEYRLAELQTKEIG
jgi:DNA polymerase